MFILSVIFQLSSCDPKESLARSSSLWREKQESALPVCNSVEEPLLPTVRLLVRARLAARPPPAPIKAERMSLDQFFQDCTLVLASTCSVHETVVKSNFSCCAMLLAVQLQAASVRAQEAAEQSSNS